MTMAKSWRDVLITPQTTIREAIQRIDSSSLQIALAVDEQQRLAGTVTDGDVRRGILRGISLDDAVQTIMNTRPITARRSQADDVILALMKTRHLHHIPIVDDAGRLVDVEILYELIRGRQRPNWVMLMAGGLGSRLRPLTNDCPKPLLKVGNKPLLETILENFVESGFHRFYISVNYKAEMIEDYFGDGGRWDSEIRYIRENKKMGTAGALSLLPEEPQETVLVMNGDLLTKVNFGQLLNFHDEHEAQATMCVREYDFQVPYGVVDVNDHRITALLEKPVHKFFVNAGIYALHPDAIRQVPSGEFYDMTSLFEELIKREHMVCSFPIREYWMDIGQLSDFERANAEYRETFS